MKLRVLVKRNKLLVGMILLFLSLLIPTTVLAFVGGNTSVGMAFIVHSNPYIGMSGVHGQWWVGSNAPLAGAGDINNLKAIPTDITMSLKWTKAVGYTSTVIQYSTSSQPVTPSDGINVYNGTGNNYKQTGLTAGTTYYYTAWGYTGSAYSADATADKIMMTTTAGGSIGDVLPTPPAVIPDAPSSKGWFAGLQPFSGFVQGFENAWGMATDTMPFTIGVLILLVVGILIYLKTKSPFVAIVADFAVDLGLVALGLLSPYTIGVVLAFGLGIWALENIWI